MTEEVQKVYWDAEDPLKPVEGESSAANAALIAYARMGYGRGLKPLREKFSAMEDPPTKSYATIVNWSSKLDWVARVERWEEIERKRDEAVWRGRRDELREKEWDNFARLQEIVAEMLKDVPKFIKRKEKIIEKGSPEIIDSTGIQVRAGKTEVKVITLEMDARLMINFIKTASEIGRRAAEMDKNYMAKLMNEIDFAKLSPEQVAKIAEGEHILDVLNIRK